MSDIICILFAADWLAALAIRALEHDCNARVISPLPSSIELIAMMTAASQTAILVPYDCDKNFEPTLNRGHTAHWCMLAGFIRFSRSNNGTIQRFTTAQQYRQAMSTMPNEMNNDDDVYVFAYHGKSRHPGIWSYQSLKLSNENLIESTTKNDDYRLPIEGLTNALRSKCVLLERTTTTRLS